MDLNGEKVIKAAPERVYQLLTDPAVLTEVMPGLKRLTETAPGVYQAEMEMGVAAIRGRYQGEMQIVDPEPPHRYRLKMKGQGPGGFVDVDLTTELESVPEGTRVVYRGVAQVGGKVAGVGQRLIGGVASMILGQFFGGIEKRATAAS
ncbi:MAG: carbon monoxide dehydrogenase subunit G [Firmicutes bacterium]|nr:carbon monoxide dehydrogenase subunit G [Bacillota bacterium]